MTYTIIDPTAADYQKALADLEQRLREARQRIADLEAEGQRLRAALRAQEETHDVSTIK